MTTGMMLLVWIVAAWALTGVTQLTFLPAAGAVAIIYLIAGRGIGGLHAPAAGGHGTGIVGGIGSLFRTSFHLVVGFATFAGLMIIGFAATGSSPQSWQPIGPKLLIFVSLTALVAGIAAKAARGNKKLATWIFSISLVVVMISVYMPRLAEMARPKAVTPMAVTPIPAPTTKLEEADQAASEGRGAIPVIAETVKKAAIGDRFLKRTVSYVGSAFRDVIPDRPRRAPRAASATTVVIAPAGPISECSTPCVMHVGWDTHIKTGAQPVLVQFYGKQGWFPLSGRDGDIIPLDVFAPGQAQFASPDDSTVVTVQLYRAK